MIKTSEITILNIQIPDNVTDEEEDKIVLGVHNRIRRILGLEEQDSI